MSEIFDWENMPEIGESLEESPPQSRLLTNVIAFAGCTAISFGASIVGGQGAKMYKKATAKPCPDLPTDERLHEISTIALNAPSNYQTFMDSAEAAGLQFVPGPFNEETKSRIMSAETPEEATNAVSVLTKKYFNFSTTLMSEISPKDTIRYKEDLANFVEDSTGLPIQLIEGSVSELRISQKEVNDTDANAKAAFISENKAIIAKPLYTWETFNHELKHAIDDRVCSTTNKYKKDTAYTLQNPKGFKYGKKNWTKEGPTASYTLYGETSADEDKAEVFDGFLNYSDDYRDWLSPGGVFLGPQSQLRRVVGAKLIILLERIDSILPGSASYLSSLSRWRHEEYGPDEADYSDKKVSVEIKR